MNANSAVANLAVRRRPTIKKRYFILSTRDPKNKERMDTGLLKVFFSGKRTRPLGRVGWRAVSGCYDPREFELATGSFSHFEKIKMNRRVRDSELRA